MSSDPQPVGRALGRWRAPGIVAVFVIAAVATGAWAATRDATPSLRVETVAVEATRGRILDRTGRLLVEDGTVLQVELDRPAWDGLDATAQDDLLDALAGPLALDRAQRHPTRPGLAAGAPITTGSLAARLSGAPGDDAVVLAIDVGVAVRDLVGGEPDRFPGVEVVPVAARTYAYGALLAHVLGHVGPDGAGAAGIEASMDDELRGRPGEIAYEVDARGNRVRELTDRRREPKTGRDVYLTVDIGLQYLVEKGLAAEVERRRGVVDAGCFLPGGCDPKGAASVAIDPRNGEVLALASYPTYDPMLFAGAISPEDDETIAADDRGDEHDFPLLDRAIAGQYAPASTFKPFVAHAGLATDLITPSYVYEDTGVYRYSADCPVEVENSCSAQNAGATVNGAIDLAEALTVSSDTYFSKLGDDAWRQRDRLGEEALQDEVATWGLGEPTGIDLSGETAGRIPTPAWLRDFSAALIPDDPDLAEEAGTWTAGTSGNLAVGQGDVLVTPLQLAQGYATLANGGTIWRPRLVLQVTDHGAATDVVITEPEATGAVDVPASWRDPLVSGLDGVTKTGTAATAFAGFDQTACPVMGKTGTAQVNDTNDTSLFVAVAPTPAPGRDAVISLATVVDGAGFGAAAAVPVARRVLEPLAAAGCDVTAFGSDLRFAAPLGGRFDVAEAVAAYIPPVATSSD